MGLMAFASPTGLRSGTRLNIEFRNVVGELVVVLNCEFQVFVGVRFCVGGRRVVFTTGHLQIPCAVERLIGYVVEGIALLGMFCALNGIAQFGMFCSQMRDSGSFSVHVVSILQWNCTARGVLRKGKQEQSGQWL